MDNMEEAPEVKKALKALDDACYWHGVNQSHEDMVDSANKARSAILEAVKAAFEAGRASVRSKAE